MRCYINFFDNNYNIFDFRIFYIYRLEHSHEEAVYAVDEIEVDWKEQAALKAEDYLDYSSFSREGLIEQLEYEGFTREQAEYGVEAVGY
ncbi:Host cell surface-exposed lipoprotein [Natranaerofaba carboxydovora]|nr:Host cell surface-exposed lipoprotein [Natranaerofaba carboxydovora]